MNNIRIKTILFLILLFSFSFYPVQAQSLKSTDLTVDIKDKSVKDVFKTISKVSNYKFFYDESIIDDAIRVNLNLSHVSLNTILKELEKKTGLKFMTNDNTITVSSGNTPTAKPASQKILTGSVINEEGKPIVGASVAVKGTTNVIVTDVDGNFSLSTTPNATLIITYLSYKTKEITVGNKMNIIVTLVEDTKALSEVVVIGYGTVKKSDLTGAVSSVGARQFKDQPMTNMMDAIQGRMPGVEVTSTSGEGSTKIRIRGTTSINATNEPLYVVDGIIGAYIGDPSEIESIEILKDASSTAIYGSRGANGVVLITTKRGKEGITQVTFETELGAQILDNPYQVMNAYEYAQALNDIKGANTISTADMKAYKYGTKGIDWLDIMTQTAQTQNYRLAITGGNKDYKYRISGNVVDASPIFITRTNQRYQFRTNLDTKVTSWLSINTDVSAYKINQHNGSPNFFTVLAYSPTMEMTDKTTGIYNMDPYNLATALNPYSSLKSNSYDSEVNHLNGNIDFRFSIADGLSFSVQAGMVYTENLGLSFTSALSQPGAIASTSSRKETDFGWQNTDNLTYHKTFGDHSLTATAVLELSKSQATVLSLGGSGLQTESVGYWNIANATTIGGGNSYSAEAMSSGFGRLIYNYKGRYIVTGTMRADGSSKFQGKNKWGYFPSGAIAWNVAEEDFMKGQNIFRQLKLRASAGIAGNQAISAYSTLGSLSQANYWYGTSEPSPGYWADKFATPDLTWEQTKQYDAGVDFGILDGKMNFTIDYYKKETNNMLSSKSIPGYNGGGTFWINQGSMRNTGWEFSVNAFPLKRKDFYWETTLNASLLKNEVLDLAGDAQRVRRGGDGSYSSILKPGYPVGSFYLYRWAGFNDEGANLYYTADNLTTTDPTGDDKVVKGQADPKWSLGWNNLLSWKNWQANFFFRANLGQSRLNSTRYMLSSMTGVSRFVRLSDAYFKGWDKVENKADALYPSLTNSFSKSYGESDFWLEDASFLKLKNVSVSYRIPRKVAKIAEISLSLSAQNLFVLSKYSGMDPETYNDVDGMDLGAYPNCRTYTFGFKADF